MNHRFMDHVALITAATKFLIDINQSQIHKLTIAALCIGVLLCSDQKSFRSLDRIVAISSNVSEKDLNT
jgi:hypothetical protein